MVIGVGKHLKTMETHRVQSFRPANEVLASEKLNTKLAKRRMENVIV